MINEKNFSLTIMLSLIMHILLFMIFPYITPPPAKVYSYSEVDLSKVSFDDIKEKIEDEVKIVDKKSPVDINEKDKIIPQESEDINKLMIPENKGYQLVSPKYGVNLPSRAQQEAGDKFQVSIKNDKGAPTDVPFGEPDIKEHNLAPDTNIFNNREGIYRPGMEDGKETPTQESVKGHYSKFKEKYVPPAAQKPKEEITKEEPLPISQYSSLGGTIGNRQVLHEPKSPEIELDKDIEIEVKFFVLPNGRVREVIPVIKGDTHLESIAIQYMKSWIFVPLPKNVEQVEQWGKLKIKFKKVTTN